ncbi:hypothetical protein IWX78_000016 [Mycetocola sp. CAN_C7]|uniref:sortase n=1 Tax=Mycetocola sp. CAN_C7 TaxID=2787724 RepID=UPI0018C93B04
MLKKTFAALVLAVLAIFAVPAAANAYGSGSDVTVEGPVVAGGNVTVVFGPGAFAGAQNISFTIEGNGNVTLAAFKAATFSTDKTSAADGSVSVDVVLPENASGTYNLTGVDEDGTIQTAALTVTAADGGTDADGDGLPDTGSEVPVLALWTAGGALALGAALIAVMTIVRRQRLSQD